MLHHHFSSSHDADRTGRDCDRAATVDQAGQIVSAGTIGMVGGIAAARANVEIVSAKSPSTFADGR